MNALNSVETAWVILGRPLALLYGMRYSCRKMWMMQKWCGWKCSHCPVSDDKDAGSKAEECWHCSRIRWINTDINTEIHRACPGSFVDIHLPLCASWLPPFPNGISATFSLLVYPLVSVVSPFAWHALTYVTVVWLEDILSLCPSHLLCCHGFHLLVIICIYILTMQISTLVVFHGFPGLRMYRTVDLTTPDVFAVSLIVFFSFSKPIYCSPSCLNTSFNLI